MAGAQQVEDYLKKIDPVLAQAKAGLFKFILEGVDFTMKNADSCKKECNNLLLSMQMSRGNYIQASSEKEYEEAVQYVTVIAQFFDANYMPDSDPRKTQRDWNSYYSVSNFNWLIQQERPGTKFIVWAHNLSLMKDIPGQNFGSTGSFGKYLKEMYGNAYYVMGLVFNKGNFRAKEFVPGKTLDEMQPIEITLDPAKQNSPEWYLAQTKKDRYIINFRNTMVPENVNNGFLSKEMNTRVFFAFVVKAQIENSYIPISVGKCFDGLLFIDNTTATRPIKKE
jgi:erythromycin esterase